MAELPKAASLWCTRPLYLEVQLGDHLLCSTTFVGEGNMTKKISVVACLSILISIPILFVCSDATAAVYSSISGRVVAEDTKQGVSGVRVTVFLVGGAPEDRSETVTDDTGLYVLKDLKPGVYLMGFSKEDSFYLNETPHVEVVLPKGKHAVNMNHALMLGGSVSGTVYEADGITPASGVAVCAAVPLAQQDWIEQWRFGVTDSAGKFMLQGVPESDRCMIWITVPGHARIVRTVNISKGMVTGNVDFTVKWDDPTGISGWVRSSVDYKPIIGASINLKDSAGNEIGFTRTDQTGKYSIVGVSPGTYRAIAFWPKGGGWTEKQDILIKSGKSTEVNFEFNKLAPETKGPTGILRRLFGLFMSNAYAAGDSEWKVKLQFLRDCHAAENMITDAFNAVKDNIKGSSCLPEGIRKRFDKLMKDGYILVNCVDCKTEASYNVCGFVERAGGHILNVCWSGITGCRCLKGTLFHELIHMTQAEKKKQLEAKKKPDGSSYSKEEINDILEKEAYGCEHECFTALDTCEKPKKYKDSECEECD
jgi:hypothetical protein